jgi:hypothetical protein
MRDWFKAAGIALLATAAVGTVVACAYVVGLLLAVFL